ncbi:MAG TPA: biotin-dependent carboxyltransferase family protein [Enterovirga sp.]|nr:biotin-dependent carboxyltransferase family protein [Enterovirga sp.]
MTALIVHSCGPMTSLQDNGRIGQGRYGMSRSGAMDRLALAAANALVGNEPGIAAIEIMLLGGCFALAEGSACIALAGAPFSASLDGAPLAPFTATVMQAGQALTIGSAASGIFAYLAVSGGFALEPDLGSLSLQRRAGIGGFKGRALQAGDELPLLRDSVSGRDLLLELPQEDPAAPIRVVLGPQAHEFTEAVVSTFLGSVYAVTAEADRMGYRLSGPKLEHTRGHNIVSDGLIAGSVQVPGAGMPIVMMADHQTTGGYPKIATVVSADLRRLAQKRPGETIRFAAIGVEEAGRLAREQAAFVASLPGLCRPVRAGLPDVAALLTANLAGAVTDALAAEL